MSNIALILQTAEHTYTKVTRKSKKPIKWEESIKEKINKFSKHEENLKTYKSNKEKMSKENPTQIKRLARTEKIALNKVKDIDKLVALLDTYILVYNQKNYKLQEKKEWMRKNTLFELYRGRYYRMLKENHLHNTKLAERKLRNSGGKCGKVQVRKIMEEIFNTKKIFKSFI